MLPVPAAIGFDIDHTLLVDNKLERVAFLHLLGTLLAEGGAAIGPLPVEIEAIDALLARQRGGACSIDDAVGEFATLHGCAAEARYAASFRSTALRMVDDFVIPLPGAVDTLAALRACGIALAVLSNGWNPLQQRKAARAGFHGVVLTSAELGVQKPSPAAFAALVGVLQVPPARTWYVGDDPYNDVAGAAAAGLVPVWLDAEAQPYPSELAPPARRIERLSELPLLAVAAVPS